MCKYIDECLEGKLCKCQEHLFVPDVGSQSSYLLNNQIFLYLEKFKNNGFEIKFIHM